MTRWYVDKLRLTFPHHFVVVFLPSESAYIICYMTGGPVSMLEDCMPQTCLLD